MRALGLQGPAGFLLFFAHMEVWQFSFLKGVSIPNLLQWYLFFYEAWHFASIQSDHEGGRLGSGF